MGLEFDPVVLNGSNYVVWALDMKNLLKSKGLWQYTNIVVLDPTDCQENFIVDGKKDEGMGVIMTYMF